MAMIGGEIDISNPLDITGTGMAFARFEAWAEGIPAEYLGATGFLQGMKDYFEKDSAAIVAYIQGNAEPKITVHTTDSGLQRTPNPNLADTDTQGPSVDKELTGTIE